MLILKWTLHSNNVMGTVVVVSTPYYMSSMCSMTHSTR